MANHTNTLRLVGTYFRRSNALYFALVAALCSASYFLAIWHNSRGAAEASILKSTPLVAVPSCDIYVYFRNSDVAELDFEPHHTAEATLSVSRSTSRTCDVKYSDYVPVHGERRIRCLVSAPVGYRNPFSWPASRHVAWTANLPRYKEIVSESDGIRVDGDKYRFTDNSVVGRHVDDMGRLVPLTGGAIRTALDIGCKAASWGVHMLSRGILAMSLAPQDSSSNGHVHFALERGVPAMLGALGTHRLPFPARAFDLVRCYHCHVPWHLNDELFLMEVDRVLRPGGYWVLSDQQSHVAERVAASLCWKKLSKRGDIVIWQKPINHIACKSVHFCSPEDPDIAWYKKMEACITALPEKGNLENWPKRLMAVPPRIISGGSVLGVTPEMFLQDAEYWKKQVGYYKSVINQLGQKGRYRNLLDMNARFGGFAAALIDDPVWVMNVMPTAASTDTLGVIYERGLIGTYQDWCEAMTTYPRTYDVLHADFLFTLYKDRCDMEDILFEMDRILRPDGTVIFRDDVDILMKIKKMADGLRWDSQIVDREDGTPKGEKLLLVVKTYWTAHDQDQEQLMTWKKG